MGLSRRLFLSSVSVLAPGCTSLDPRSTSPTARPDRDGDGVPDGVDDYPTDDRRAVKSYRATGTVTLQPGEFGGAVALTDSPDDSGDIVYYEVSVDGETGIDCLVFRRAAWDAYIDGSLDVDVVEAYSRVDVTAADVTVQLDEGEYLFALDYTALLTDPGRTQSKCAISSRSPNPADRTGALRPARLRNRTWLRPGTFLSVGNAS